MSQHGPRRRTTTVVTLVLALLGLAGAMSLGAPAHAHTDLIASSPAAGEAVPWGTDQLSLSFAQEVVPDSGSISVLGPSEEDVTDGPVVVEGSLVHVALALREAGSYAVAYRVVAADGHVVVGSFDFDVVDTETPPADGLAPLVPVVATSHPDAVSSGGTAWRWALSATTVGGVLLLLHARRRRRFSQPRGPHERPSQ